MFTSRKFSTKELFPFCIESDIQSDFVAYYDDCGIGPTYFDITNSGINTTKKSMQFYWLLRTLTVVITVLNTYADEEFTSTTTLDFRYLPFSESFSEPYQRVCPSFIGYNTINSRAEAIPTPFYLGDEIAIHYGYIPLIRPDVGDFGATEETLYPFGITTFNVDYGYTCYDVGLDANLTNIDQTIPITFGDESEIGPYTLYVKFVAASLTASKLQLIDAYVEDYTYYTIE